MFMRTRERRSYFALPFCTVREGFDKTSWGPMNSYACSFDLERYAVVIFWLRMSEGCYTVRQSKRLNGCGMGRSPNDVEDVRLRMQEAGLSAHTELSAGVGCEARED